MKNSKSVYLVLLTILISTTAFSQNGSSLISRFQPESKLWLEGTSTLHDFTITANNIKSSINFESSMNENNSLEEFKITYLKLIVPIWKLDSGNESMDENMQEALSAEVNPNIVFELISPVVFSFKNVIDSITINATGNLTVAGTKKSVDLNITVVKQSENEFEFKGEIKLLMTDFGVEPPSMFFGTMNTGNEITVKFEMILNRK
jgi:polyisoprenoid-binding protein YceI